MSISNLADEDAQQLAIQANSLTVQSLSVGALDEYEIDFASIGNPIPIVGRKGVVRVTGLTGNFPFGTEIALVLTGIDISAFDACLLTPGPYPGKIQVQISELTIGMEAIATSSATVLVRNILTAGVYAEDELVFQFLLI